MLVGPTKQLKQIIPTEHNIVLKNPNGPEANQFGLFRSVAEDLNSGQPSRKQIQVVARAGLEPGIAGLRVRHADHSATLPP